MHIEELVHMYRTRQMKYVVLHFLVEDTIRTYAFLHVHFLVPILFTLVQVHGTSAGGDADELRLLSTSDTFIRLHAKGGSLDFLSTKVFSAY